MTLLVWMLLYIDVSPWNSWLKCKAYLRETKQHLLSSVTFSLQTTHVHFFWVGLHRTKCVPFQVFLFLWSLPSLFSSWLGLSDSLKTQTYRCRPSVCYLESIYCCQKLWIRFSVFIANYPEFGQNILFETLSWLQLWTLDNLVIVWKDNYLLLFVDFTLPITPVFSGFATLIIRFTVSSNFWELVCQIQCCCMMNRGSNGHNVAEAVMSSAASQNFALWNLIPKKLL